VRRTKITP